MHVKHITNTHILLCVCLVFMQHRDLADLERVLNESQGSRSRFIVSDGVFSMDGTVAPLRDILALADKYNV